MRPCVACGGALAPYGGATPALPAVTSDCRPWRAGRSFATCTSCGLTQRLTEGDHEADTAAMYADYAMFAHAGTGDQKTFFDGAGAGRTAHVLAACREHVGSVTGRFLDVGSGSGSGLSAIGAAFPEAELWGLEPFDDPLERVGDSVPNLRGVLRDWSELSGPYNMITLFHALEHLADPVGALGRLRALMAPGGHLLIEVPYFPDNPFDLVVADHVSHFRAIDILTLLKAADFRPLFVRTDIIKKEITALATAAADDDAAVICPEDREAVDVVPRHLDWLQRLAAQIRHLADEGPFGVYGTGPAAAWVLALADAAVQFFVDDDPDRQGKEFHGRPILPPKLADRDLPVFLAFVPDLALRIRDRHAHDGRRYIVPTPLA